MLLNSQHFVLPNTNKPFKKTSYKTYRVTPTTIEQANSLKTLEKLFELDFWSTLRSLNKPVDVMVKPKFQSSFEYMLHMHNIKYETLIEDVER